MNHQCFYNLLKEGQPICQTCEEPYPGKGCPKCECEYFYRTSQVDEFKCWQCDTIFYEMEALEVKPSGKGRKNQPKTMGE